MGELVQLPGDGPSLDGYLAAGEGAGLGVLVVPEQHGLAPHVRDVCDRLAAEGFTALAADVSELAQPTSDIADTVRRLSPVVDWLAAHPLVRGHGVGVVGFGTGGGLGLWLASLRPDQVRAVVPFYGVIPEQQGEPDWDRLEVPVEGHFGEKDGRATSGLARVLEQALSERGKDVRLFFYPGVGHAFFDDTRPDAYDEDAARQAWVRTLEFLRAKLG